MSEIINSREAEMSVLGSILYDPGVFPRVYGLVKAEDFFNPVHRNMFRIMYHLYTNNMDVNTLTVWNEIQKRNITDVEESYLNELMDYRVNAEVAMSFATQISEFAGYRELQYELSNILPSVKDRDKPLTSFVSEIMELAKRLSSKGTNSTIVTGEELIESYFEMLKKKRGDFMLTGIERIDKHLIDLSPKEITLIAARPGVGKSAMLLQSARLNMEAGKKVGYISMEMHRSSLVHRMVSALTMVDGTVIRKMEFDEVVHDARVHEATRYVEGMPWYVTDTGPFTDITLARIIRTMVYEHECDIIYVDYIQLINAEGALRSTNRNEQLTAISRDLKGLSMELDIPIVAAAQLNRESMKSVTARPTLAHLRDSGALEQDASLIIFLYPDLEKMLQAGLTEVDVDAFIESQDKVAIKFEVAKQRNGRTFVEDLMFNKPVGRFEETTKSY